LCKRLEVVPGLGTSSNFPGFPGCSIPLTLPSGGNSLTSGTTIVGNAAIGGGSGGISSYSTAVAYYNFSETRQNLSTIAPGTLINCIWDWGDGTVQNFPASDARCQRGTSINHVYPDVRGLINRTNGYSGCYRYTLTLTNYFNSGIPTASESRSIYSPRGIANDAINPITGRGICDGKYRRPSLPILPDTNPASPPAYWTTFPVSPPYP
jgi:hypothetical protein